MRVGIGKRTRLALTTIICGDMIEAGKYSISPYRTHRDLEEFLLEDLGLSKDALVEESRPKRTEHIIKHYNGSDTMKQIIEASVRHEYFVNTDYSLEASVEYLNSYLQYDGFKLLKRTNKYVLTSLSGVKLVDDNGKSPDILSDEYVTELYNKCEEKLSTGDLDGAITNARTLLETVVGEIEKKLKGKKGSYRGDLPKQYKQVTKLMRLDEEREDLDQRFKDVVRGLVQVVHGLAPISSRMGDRC